MTSNFIDEEYKAAHDLHKYYGSSRLKIWLFFLSANGAFFYYMNNLLTNDQGNSVRLVISIAGVFLNLMLLFFDDRFKYLLDLFEDTAKELEISQELPTKGVYTRLKERPKRKFRSFRGINKIFVGLLILGWCLSIYNLKIGLPFLKI